tara:strand:- start:920 stop:1909 length:990 start_codon:yes stop_codon:yes gene_type:complete
MTSIASIKNAPLSFKEKLSKESLYPIKAIKPEILQLNLGYLCNQTCSHCHVDAGPRRKEIMTQETMLESLRFIKKANIKTVDLTGGAPEMNPDFLWLLKELHKLKVQIIVRSNLSILVSNKHFRKYPFYFKKYGVCVIASLPCYTEENTDNQRGKGVFKQSIEAIKLLNTLGYSNKEKGLELHLVYNPSGPFLPPDQLALEKNYKKKLYKDYGITFNQLYTITNMPIRRFLNDLLRKDKFEEYMQLLINAFNPASVKHLMCRNTISVSWTGHLYDCDFNQMLDIKTDPKLKQHISLIELKKIKNRNIQLGNHCYGCTAGSGSSCQGSLI